MRNVNAPCSGIRRLDRDDDDPTPLPRNHVWDVISLIYKASNLPISTDPLVTARFGTRQEPEDPLEDPVTHEPANVGFRNPRVLRFGPQTMN